VPICSNPALYRTSTTLLYLKNNTTHCILCCVVVLSGNIHPRHRTELRPVQEVSKNKYKICISRNATLKFQICRII
jgi:hypothetical protein